MIMPQPLTKIIGRTERTLQVLLASQLEQAGIGFPEWTVLTFLSGSGTLARPALLSALQTGQIASGGRAESVLNEMMAKGLIVATATEISLTEDGKALFAPLRANVQTITGSLVADIPADDLEVTNRTLERVTARAEGLLASNPR